LESIIHSGEKMRIKGISTTVFLCALGLTGQCFSSSENIANLRAFESFEGEQLTIITYGEYADNTRLIYFGNFNHAWNNKVLLHHYDDTTNIKKYKLTKKTGNKFRPYKHFTVITDTGDRTLYNGSIVPVISIYLPQRSKTIKMHQISQGKHTANEIIDKYKKQEFEVKW